MTPLPRLISVILLALTAPVWSQSGPPSPVPWGNQQFSNAGIVVTTTSRLAGAVHSITWRGREFIDSTDHGRQMQSAASFDNTPEAGPETFNPTEAGSRLDGAGPRSTSQLLAITRVGSNLETRTRMAFWLAP